LSKGAPSNAGWTFLLFLDDDDEVMLLSLLLLPLLLAGWDLVDGSVDRHMDTFCVSFGYDVFDEGGSRCEKAHG
jgi:hypothetical protein